MFRRFGVRSALRVPMPLGTEVFGSLFFLSRLTDSFSEDDVDFARRVADHLALALSHERLAEAARSQAESREVAARLEAQVATLTRELEARTGQRRVVGQSKQWRDVLAHAARVAHTETTVLLTGESGTGKEVVARFIHHASRRSLGPFVAINCAALPDQLLESELFGHERGAFTGAVVDQARTHRAGHGGVLFLDEVGEMAPTVQAKLLRVLEEREFMRLGSTRVVHADIRVIAATNRDLHAAMQRGEFREDLYYRLGVFEIALPPLRERLDDVLELADAFLAEIGETVGRPAAGISREARDHLLAYAWPGNVRELRNAIERAVILADGGFIRSEHLPVTAPRTVASKGDDTPGGPLPAGGVNLEAIERSLVVKALTPGAPQQDARRQAARTDSGTALFTDREVRARGERALVSAVFSQRARHLTFAVGSLLTFIVLAGVTYQSVATALERRQFPYPGRLIDVGDHQLHIYCVGEGAPTVVLEAPAAGISVGWAWVQDDLGQTTRVCSYDRAGLGWSEAGEGGYRRRPCARRTAHAARARW